MTERTATERYLPWAAVVIALFSAVGTAAVGQHRLNQAEIMIAGNLSKIERNDAGIDTLFKENVQRQADADEERLRLENSTNLKVQELELKQQTIIENQRRLEEGQNILLQEIRRLGD